jgi:hypothetical protein
MYMKFPVFKGTAAIKIAIGVVASIVVVVGGFMLVQNVFTKASDSAPRDLIISDITTNTVKIAWTTDQETQGVVEYGASPTSLNLFSPESQKTKSHVVEITLLSPTTSYYFQIRIGETKYDNGGVPWTFATKIQQQPVLSGPITPSVASGTATITPSLISPTSSSAFGPLKGSTLKITGTPIPTTRIIPTSTATLTPTPGLTSFYCTETDCQKICLKQKTGECSTMDLQRYGNSCVGKVNFTSCYWITPTVTPMPTSTPTATPTATPTPTNTPTPTS